MALFAGAVIHVGAPFASPQQNARPASGEDRVHAEDASRGAEEDDERAEEDGGILAVGRPEPATFRPHVIEEEEHSDGGAEARHRAGQQQDAGHELAGHHQHAEERGVRHDDRPQKLMVGAEAGTAKGVTDEIEHLLREGLVSQQLPEVGDEQDDPEMQPENQQQ